MAPTDPKLQQVHVALIATVLDFFGTSDAWFQTPPTFFDYPPDIADIWTLVPSLAIFPDPDGVEFVTDDRQMVALRQTMIVPFLIRGLTEAQDRWGEIYRLEVDVRRAILENAGLGCAATATLPQAVIFSTEQQRKEDGLERRSSFEMSVAIQTQEAFA